MTPFYADPLVTLYLGDCLDVMRELPDASVDAVVTDPPYLLQFMGKHWDAPSKMSGHNDPSLAEAHGGAAHDHGFTGHWQPNVMQDWHRQWATEAFRVLKPGGYLLAFGGTRTYHRLAAAIEDAGFEIRDTLMWIYASGFPKSLDVSKALDKVAPRAGQFEAFAAHLRERRIASGAKQKDVAKHFPSKTGGLTGCVANWELGYNVPTVEQWAILQPMLDLSDEWLPLIERAEAEREIMRKRTMVQGGGSSLELRMGERREVDADITAPATDLARQWEGWGTALKPAFEPIVMARKPLVGTVAANVTRYGTGAINVDGCRIGYMSEADRASAETTQGNNLPGDAIYGNGRGMRPPEIGMRHFTPQGGRWPSNVLLSDPELFDEPNPGVVGSGQVVTSTSAVGAWAPRGAFPIDNPNPVVYGDSGGYSRFFIIPKADRGERERGLAGAPKRAVFKGNMADNPKCLTERANVHPTVKPIDLMRHLVRLVTPSGGTVLDPFLGSGTTALAASEEGFHCIGIEREAEYLDIAKGRLMATPMGLGLDAEMVQPPRKQVDGVAVRHNSGGNTFGGDNPKPPMADMTYRKPKPPKVEPAPPPGMFDEEPAA